MNTIQRITIAALALGALVFTTAPASAISIGLDRLLGTVEPGVPASEADEMVMLNFLVAGYNAGNPTGTNLGDNPGDSGTEKNWLLFSTPTSIPALPTAPLGTTWESHGPAVPTVDLGTDSYDWVAGKYGRNTAFFYIGGLTGEIVLPSLTGGIFQSTDADNAVSHTTLFNKISVPDCGGTIFLLVLGIAGSAGVRRKLGGR